MKAKIFAKLKQEYAPLGLGDEILMSRAETLASIGLVTDENIDAVVALQRKDLETLQKANDKRVGEALEKERRKHEEEVKKAEKEREEAKAEEAKRAAEAKAKEEAEAKALAQKKAAEAKEAEEVEQKKAREEALEKIKKDVSPEVIEILRKEREAAAKREQDYNLQLKKFIEEAEAREKKHLQDMEQLKSSYSQVLESSNTLKGAYDALKQEHDAAKAQKALSDRKQFILDKAKELGVPDWRVDEGFVIADDADEAAITEVISKVANNVKTQMLPSSGRAFPLSDGKPTANDVADLAKTIVK